MTSVVYANARIPWLPIDVDAGWDQLVVTWTGHDGSVWLLSEPEAGVFITRGGFRGLGHAPVTHYRDRSPGVGGAQWRGFSWDPREVFWALHMFHDGSTREFVERDAAFWESLFPGAEGTLEVTVPGVSTRRVRLRFNDDGNWAPDLDPTYFGWASYGVTLQADQPLWEGEPIWERWGAEDNTPFHGGLAPGAPIINISRGRTITSAKIHNPGEETWGIWYIYGDTDATGAVLNMAGGTVEVPIELAAGQAIRIDTRPTENTAYQGTYTIDAETGAYLFTPVTDIFTSLGEYDPAPLPRRATTALDLVMVGGGSIAVEIPTLYPRAW